MLTRGDTKLRMKLHDSLIMWSQVVTCQIENIIFSLPQNLWTSNLARWWLMVTEKHSSSHMTLWLLSLWRHVKNLKRNITLYARFMVPKLNWDVIEAWRLNQIVAWKIKSSKLKTSLLPINIQKTFRRRSFVVFCAQKLRLPCFQ